MTEENKKDIGEQTESLEETAEVAENTAEVSAEETAEKSDKKEKTDKKADKKLKSELESAQKALEEEKQHSAELSDKYLRLAAEYENFRKRTQNERKSIYGDAVVDTLTGLLPTIDNLQYAAKYSVGDPEKLAEGLNLILGKLPETLEKLGISSFGEAGETFDPTIHNAVMHEENDAYGEGEIIDVLQQGYKYGERILRYAMVKVAN